jgi:hypothetical protein
MTRLFSKFSTAIFVSSWLLLLSCVKSPKSTVTGLWSIDSVSYEGRDIRTCLAINSIYFQKDKVTLPALFCDEIINFKKDGEWSLKKTDERLALSIDSENAYFAGSYSVRFHKDEFNKLLKMTLTSNKTIIVCRKGLFEFEKNRREVEYLINKFGS